MNNRKVFAAHLPAQGIVPCYIHELSACSSSKIMKIYAHAAAYEIAEILSPIAGLLQNRTGEKEQPQAPK